jgi:hypothetical protein
MDFALVASVHVDDEETLEARGRAVDVGLVVAAARA